MRRLKLDENLGSRLLQLARAAGHDAESVSTERLNGVEDSLLFERCRSERRTLVTLDLDFSSPLRFSPAGGAGTVILRPRRPSAADIESVFQTMLDRVASDDAAGQIWIVETSRLRIYRPWDRDADE
jgi:predicted nuclease of predicted toxin-antitoxin system